MAGKENEVICQSFMIKRSQNKKLFTPVNYKERLVVLTKRALIYYDADGEKRKERGRIDTSTIHTVEQAQLDELVKQNPDGDGYTKGCLYPFQVGYAEQNTDYTLFLAASDHSERLHWIHAIRTVCVSNERRSRYHPAAWAARRWPCCDAERRAAPGCALAAVWPLPEPELELIVNNQHNKIYNNVLRHKKSRTYSYQRRLDLKAEYGVFIRTRFNLEPSVSQVTH